MPSSEKDLQRTCEHIEKAAVDIKSQIEDFDLKYPWEQLLNKYFVLNKNIETIQSWMKKDDYVRTALLYPKDGPHDTLTQTTEKLSVHTHDLHKAKETKKEDFPQITSNHQLTSLTFSNPAEQQQKREMHDDIATSMYTYIDKEYKRPSTTQLKKKDKSTQRVFKLEEAKSLLKENLKQKDAAIRKQQKMKNTLLEAILTGRDLAPSKSDIALLRDAEKKYLASQPLSMTLTISKTKLYNEEIFKPVTVTTSTATNQTTTSTTASSKIKISTVPSSSLQPASGATGQVKKEEGISATPGEKSASAKKTPSNVNYRTPTSNVMRTPGSQTGRTPANTPIATPPNLSKAPSPSTGGSIGQPPITPITPQTAGLANRRPSFIPNSAGRGTVTPQQRSGIPSSVNTPTTTPTSARQTPGTTPGVKTGTPAGTPTNPLLAGTPLSAGRGMLTPNPSNLVMPQMGRAMPNTPQSAAAAAQNLMFPQGRGYPNLGNLPLTNQMRMPYPFVGRGMPFPGVPGRTGTNMGFVPIGPYGINQGLPAQPPQNNPNQKK